MLGTPLVPVQESQTPAQKAVLTEPYFRELLSLSDTTNWDEKKTRDQRTSLLEPGRFRTAIKRLNDEITAASHDPAPARYLIRDFGETRNKSYGLILPPEAIEIIE